MKRDDDKPAAQIETIEPPQPARPKGQAGQPWLTILAHPDPGRIGQRTPLFAAGADTRALSRLEPEFETEAGAPRGPLDSPFLSRKPAWFSRAGRGAVRLSPEDAGNPIQVDGQPLGAPRRFTAAELQRGVVISLAGQVALLLHTRTSGPSAGDDLGLVGASQALETLRAAVVKHARQDTPVLIRGESGVGKELVARALHTSSRRAAGPLVCINLAAIPASTAASELFGHAAGAFTGARGAHRGYFEKASGGSLLLDEIGAIGPELQAMLLRVLESGEIQPVGDGLPHKVDVRVLAATDEDLEDAMVAGRFRSPLYHRLTAGELEVPPLRQRPDDVARLLVHALRAELADAGLPARLAAAPEGASPWLPTELMTALVHHPWPGNVRQLINTARRMVRDFADAEQVDTDAILADLAEDPPPAAPADVQRADRPAEKPAKRQAPAEIDEDRLLQVLRANRFAIKPTAEALGISRTSLYALMERSPKIRKAKDIPADELEACLADCDGDLDRMVERLEVSPQALKLRLKELGLR